MSGMLNLNTYWVCQVVYPVPAPGSAQPQPVASQGSLSSLQTFRLISTYFSQLFPINFKPIFLKLKLTKIKKLSVCVKFIKRKIYW